MSWTSTNDPFSRISCFDMGKIKCVSQYYKPDSINFEKEKWKTRERPTGKLIICTAIYDLSTLTHLPEWLFYCDFLHCSGSLLLQFYWSAWNRADNKTASPKIIYTLKVQFTIFFVAKKFFSFFFFCKPVVTSLHPNLGIWLDLLTTWTESDKLNRLQLDANK